ncbi:MAG: SDR family oxidoreductase [Pseudomonadota bacterium]
MVADRVVVITGSTRGIGLGLARAMLARNCRVVVSGRGEDAVRNAVAQLGGESDRLTGMACDVRSADALNALWQAAQARFERVDIWVHNAGTGIPMTPAVDLRTDDIQRVIDTNLTGSLLAARCALRGLTAQGSGALFLMQGLGASGPAFPGAALYGSSKAGVRYLTDVLIKEAKGSTVIVGALSPGIVVTDLVTNGDPASLPEKSYRFLDQVSDTVETVTPFLADRILATRRNGVFINWLTKSKLAWRLAIWPFHKRRVLSGAGGGSEV